MTEVSFADIEYQIRHLPTEKLPLVYQFIRSLSESGEISRSDSKDKEDYDFTKTDLWKMRGVVRIIEEGQEGADEKEPKKTNYAATVDEVVYGVSLAHIQKNDKKDSC